MKIEKALFALHRARAAAGTLVEKLGPACHRIEIAGSVRREAAMVHDIDLVAWPVREQISISDLFGGRETLTGGPDLLAAAITELTKEVVHSTSDSKILHFLFEDMPVEIYLAEPDGSNFEALLQMRTGPEEHNKMLARRALALRMYYHAGYGIYKLGKDMRFSARVDDGTEKGIYTALQFSYPAPQARG